jgi:hypothetical protein
MSKKLSLKDLLHKIDWVQIESVRATWKLNDDAVAIGFFKSKKELLSANEVRIRLGINVLKKLKWKAGDKIVVYHHPDDLMSFMVVKTENGKGFTLSRETGTTTTHRVQFRWDRPIPIQEMKAKEVDFLIHKDQCIVFRVDENLSNKA